MPLTRARISTFAFFALNGFTFGMWVVNIPEIRDRTGASTVALGYLLLLMGSVALIGMQVGGWLIDRFGSRTVLTVSGLALSLVVVGPGFATSTAGLAAALVTFGAFNGVVDVAQNAQAVEVEREYGRPIMSSFHAFFSLGGLLASLLGGGLIALGVDVRWSLAGAAVAGVLLVLTASRTLLRPTHLTTREPGAASSATRCPSSRSRASETRRTS